MEGSRLAALLPFDVGYGGADDDDFYLSRLDPFQSSFPSGITRNTYNSAVAALGQPDGCGCEDLVHHSDALSV